MTQEEDKERPIPYIIDLSSNGILQIGWDKRMRPPETIDTIPPTKIAVEAHINIEEIRFWENSRSLKSIGDVVKLPKDPELVYFANETSRFYERM